MKDEMTKLTVKGLDITHRRQKEKFDKFSTWIN
jgi:hypothetical protein